METRANKEKTESVKEEGEKAMMKETIKSLPELMELPVEVLAKIFNFLPSHDIYCGVSMACKKFYEISKDQSLVSVKDLSIRGRYYWSEGKQHYGLRNIGNVCDIIEKSKDLTTLKIKALNDESINRLASTALQACPKLINLEIIETFAQKWYESEYS